jgi:CBS domain-containing protein
MHPGVIRASPQTSVEDIVAQMASHRVHCVVVEGLARRGDQEELVWGIVSDLDMIRATAARRSDLHVGEIAATEIITVDISDSIEEVVQLMAEHECTHLVVVAPQQREPVGVISSLDVGVISSLDVAAALSR